MAEASSIYKSTFRFFQRNLDVSFAFISVNIVYYYFQSLTPNDNLIRFMHLIISSLLVILIITYMIAVVYKKVGVYDSFLSVSSAIRKYYWKITLLSLFGFIAFATCIILFFGIFLLVAGLHPSRFYMFILQLAAILVSTPVGLALLVLAPRWLMLYDDNVPNAIKFGFQELLSNVPFYFFVSLVGVVVVASLLLSLYLGENYNWLKAFLSPLSSVWISVMYTSSFLHNHEKAQEFKTNKNSTINLKS